VVLGWPLLADHVRVACQAYCADQGVLARHYAAAACKRTDSQKLEDIKRVMTVATSLPNWNGNNVRTGVHAQHMSYSC
jgi:hypothetical protein